jgi:ferritin-like protein
MMTTPAIPRDTPPETIAAVQAALAAEHATVYGYGVLGARLRGTQQQTARDLWDAHRAKRDRLSALLVAQGVTPVAAAAAYRLPARPTSPRAAAQLAATLEEQVIAGYLGLVGVTDPKLRRFGALAMQEAATRAVRWTGGTVLPSAFPGMPKAAVSPRPD